MKLSLTAALLMLIPGIALADDKPPEAALAKHREGAAKVADQQDELSADVQQLTIEQTVPEVIELLNQVKEIMGEATDNLAKYETGATTLAAETEVIEKIHAAAKEKQKQQGSGQSGSAMMDMMERMMGKNPDGEGKGKGDKPSDKGGKGTTGLSDEANGATDGQTGGKSEARRVPKAGGSAGHALPEEFLKALDAYNRGAEQKLK